MIPSGLVFSNGTADGEWMLLLGTHMSHNVVLHGSAVSPDVRIAAGQSLLGPNSTVHVDGNSFFESYQQNLGMYCSNFSANYNLEGNVTLKTWGITQRPQGGWIATCISLHPRDMVEYVTEGRKVSVVTFCHVDSTPPDSTTSEGDAPAFNCKSASSNSRKLGLDSDEKFVASQEACIFDQTYCRHSFSSFETNLDQQASERHLANAQLSVEDIGSLQNQCQRRLQNW